MVDKGDLLDILLMLLLGVTFRGRGTRFETDASELRSDMLVLLEESETEADE